ncbi:MAG: bifunctional diaminohydroxyphosphoribosylaminopyrimidine deaminase/5-amino-6-(5-phosphoribosylamino)uracil reductase RibD [Terrimicrobiaceae bacterium]|nr:bifunctional diaminohydroxyphosphoribosylaminopyrimidine deaminase/5-amino-6-(5-phosphoribosylamino)uracil reductase RibD [Terrimicrobiaceae bacterium]
MRRVVHGSEEENFMRRAIAEARKSLGKTHPNPAVGAVIVKNGRIVSTGWHRAAGLPHAEIEALRGLSRGAVARDATLYVTLEPCSTHGKTPPCTNAILAAGIRRVVYGATDPNPAHAGRADAILQKAGIEVTRGILADDCRSLNRAWNQWISTGRPWVVAKTGASLDGRITSPPNRRWITSPAARQDAMKLRAASQAILVGGETVRTDNPRLTIRGLRGFPQPWRVVWTKSGRIPDDCHLLTDADRDRTLVYVNRPLRSVLADLGRRGVAQVLLEGGGAVLGEAFDRALVDEVVFYVAPDVLGGPVPAVAGRGVGSNEAAIRLAQPTYSRVGRDLRISGEVIRASSSGS